LRKARPISVEPCRLRPIFLTLYCKKLQLFTTLNVANLSIIHGNVLGLPTRREENCESQYEKKSYRQSSAGRICSCFCCFRVQAVSAKKILFKTCRREATAVLNSGVNQQPVLDGSAILKGVKAMSRELNVIKNSGDYSCGTRRSASCETWGRILLVPHSMPGKK
jgi:hypothetical protein